MQARSVAKYVRLSAQKCRLVADQIRSLSVEQAFEVLSFSNRQAAVLLKKALNSAIANAEHNEGADIDDLWVNQVMVDEAPVIKRFRARAKGRGTRILKRNCHITLSVSDEPRARAKS